MWSWSLARGGLGLLLFAGLLLGSAGEPWAQQEPWLDWWEELPLGQPPPRPLRPDQQPPQPRYEVPAGTVIQPPPTIPSVRTPPPLPLALRASQLFEFQLGTDLVEEYSDNFFLSSTLEIENYRTLLVPRGTMFLHGPNLEGLLSTRLSTAWDSSTKEVTFFPSARAQLTAQVTPRWTLGASGSFVKTDSPGAVNRLDIQPQRRTSTIMALGVTSNYAFTTLALRNSYSLNRLDQDEGDSTTAYTIGTGASLTLARINTLSFDYTYTHSENTPSDETGTGTATGVGTATTGAQDSSGNQTNDGHGFVLSLSREVSARLVAGASANYGWRDTEQDDDSSSQSSSGGQGTQGSSSSSFTRWGAGLFWTYTLPFLVFRGSLGFVHVSGEDVEETIPAITGSVRYFSGPLILDGSFESGVSESFLGRGVNFGVAKTLGAAGSASYAFTPKIVGRVGSSYRRTEQTGLGGGGTAGQKNSVVTATAGFTWQALQWLAIVLDYRYTKNSPLDEDSSTGGATTSGAGATSGTGVGGNQEGYVENLGRLSIKMDF